MTDVEAATADVEAANFGLVLDVSVSAGYTRLGGFDDGSLPGPDGMTTTIAILRDRYSVQAQRQYAILGTILGRLEAIGSLEALAEARHLELATERLDVRLEAKLRFHAYLGAIETASVAAASLRLERRDCAECARASTLARPRARTSLARVLGERLAWPRGSKRSAKRERPP